MPRRYVVSKEEALEIEEARKTIRDKRVDKRLHVIQLRGEGLKNPAIAEKLDTSAAVVSHWISAYKQKERGFLTISGRINKPYFMERACYGTKTNEGKG